MITIQILQVMTISGDGLLLESEYLSKHSIPTKLEWKFSFRSVRSARSGRNAYREKLHYIGGAGKGWAPSVPIVTCKV